MAEQKQNYAVELERLIAGLPAGKKPRLLLHCCCAPCSSRVLEYLSPHFSLGLLFFNPNISPCEEYERRKAELKRLVAEMPLEEPPVLLDVDYAGERFLQAAQGLEQEPEGGARCIACYRLRLKEAALAAVRGKYDFFTTTLTISPMKDAQVLNRLGMALGKEVGVTHLPSDFKKQNGYQRSVALSGRYQLYRQDYCGCVFSRLQREREKERKK